MKTIITITQIFHFLESIESKLISECLIDYYSLIAQLHIFVYE